MAISHKLKIRRRRASISFCSILMILACCGLFILFGDEENRKNLESSQAIIITLIAFLTGPIVHYGIDAQRHDEKGL